jgi:hypothetical protein
MARYLASPRTIGRLSMVLSNDEHQDSLFLSLSCAENAVILWEAATDARGKEGSTTTPPARNSILQHCPVELSAGTGAIECCAGDSEWRLRLRGLTAALETGRFVHRLIDSLEHRVRPRVPRPSMYTGIRKCVCLQTTSVKSSAQKEQGNDRCMASVALMKALSKTQKSE